MSKSTEELRSTVSHILTDLIVQVSIQRPGSEYGLLKRQMSERDSKLKLILQLFDQELAKRDDSLTVAGRQVKFSHTAVNGDMHMFIDGYHNPDVCPECIQPGLLVVTLNNQTEERGNKK